MKHAFFSAVMFLLFATLSGCCVLQKLKPESKSIDLLPGNMDSWQPVNFGGEGDVFFKDGALNLDYGSPMTGVIYKRGTVHFGESRNHYAITLQAQRVEGVDMFLGVTFPVGEDGHVSLVLGGWGGTITGISNLDELNASENATTQYHAFKDKQWCRVKILVTPEKIDCWLDDEQIVDVKRSDYTTYDTHSAVVETKPFGLFNYGTWGRVKDLKVWKLD